MSSNLIPLNENQDVYVSVSKAILKLKGIDVLCDSLRDVYVGVQAVILRLKGMGVTLLISSVCLSSGTKCLL